MNQPNENLDDLWKEVTMMKEQVAIIRMSVVMIRQVINQERGTNNISYCDPTTNSPERKRPRLRNDTLN